MGPLFLFEFLQNIAVGVAFVFTLLLIIRVSTPRKALQTVAQKSR
jgi:hypothetical protein